MSNVYKGYNGTIILGDDRLVIKRGFKGFALGGGTIRGDKTIPYQSLVAVQYKKAGVMSGFIQFSIKGGSEAKSGVNEAVKDENTVTFQINKNKLFSELQQKIESIIGSDRSNGTVPSNTEIDQLEKLANLRDKGVVSAEEFEAKKKQLLR